MHLNQTLDFSISVTFHDMPDNEVIGHMLKIKINVWFSRHYFSGKGIKMI